MKAKVNLSWITFIVIAQFVILLISSCIIGITSFYSKRDSISEMLKANTNQVAELLGKDLNSIYTIADNSYLNISVQQALQRDNAQESSVYEKYCTHQLLESLSTSHPAISDMIIYPLIGEPYHIQNDIVGIQNCYELREKKWFKQISKLESGFTLLPEENGLIIKGIERPYSVFGRTIYASSSRKIIGYQFLVVNTKWIETVSQNEKAVMQYYVCDNKNIPLLLREQEKKKFQISEREGYFTEESLINNNLKVVGHYARSYLLEESCKSIIIVLICMSPVMLLSLFCSSIWIKWIKRPTLELTGVMKQIEQGDFCIQLPHSQVEEIDHVYMVNYRAGILLATLVGQHMIDNKIKGSMVFTASVKSIQPTPIDCIYGGMKAGLKRSVQSIAREFGPFGIRANTVSPGCIAINPKGYEDKTYEGDADRIPIGRTGTGEDIGYMAAFLCSEEAGFITGADFLVDGGQACGENSMDATEDYDGIHGRGTYIVK